ncbi:Fur-regulated basic protein FbpA [Bacillus sp. ISL-40]|uniref:Fur-regulated basic protein FbpA n=1 Tax=Bacillus sp. ISL-77 TaxID=2819138 RepID=UPI001BE7FF8C|nr:Fur-regulated basic protein FbpA [Bacillus sp. ISL-40]MBT2723867.1 Fur-regulated basic protein FbpA [Bacillus sp. ISL-46]MBT2741815.1 Fur-regulated basic protein FbpA [Bacillus sp. ISL-77]
MATHLRKGLERLRQFYIMKLLDSGISDSSDHELYSLTFNELESLYKKIFSPTKS